MAKKIEENPALQSFKDFVQNQAARRNLSMRKLSLALGMTPSHVSEILSGKKNINVEFLNSLADFFQISRIEVYQAAGWVDLDEDDLMLNRVRDWYSKDQNFRQALEHIMSMDPNQRGKIFLWIFYKTLQETNRLQTPPINFDWDQAFETGKINPDALEKLDPNQRQALSGVLQLLLEAFLVKDALGEGEQFFKEH